MLALALAELKALPPTRLRHAGSQACVACPHLLAHCLCILPRFLQEYAQEYMYNEIEGPEEEGEGAEMQP